MPIKEKKEVSHLVKPNRDSINNSGLGFQQKEKSGNGSPFFTIP